MACSDNDKNEELLCKGGSTFSAGVQLLFPKPALCLYRPHDLAFPFLARPDSSEQPLARLSMARPRNDGMEDRQLFGSGAETLRSVATEAAVPEPLSELLGADCPPLPSVGRDFLERILRIQLVPPPLAREFLH